MIAAARRNSSLPAAMPALRLEFVYDHMSRRCVKRVYDKSPFEAFAPAGGDAIMEGSAAAVVQGDDEPAEPENVGGGVVIPIGWSLKSTVKFVWDGWNLSAELDGQNAVRRTCAWGVDLSGTEQGAGGVGGLVFQYLAKTNTTHHLYYDGNGNVTSLRDNGGAVSAAYEYGPFGETLTARGDEGALAYSAFKFSTKYSDAESGLLYYGYRYYNPGTGRWLSRDPIEEDGGLAQHAYVDNSPLNEGDALGLRPIDFAFDAFINSRLGTWLPEPVTTSITGGRFQFRTDNRPFGRFNYARGAHANARVYSVGTIESTRIGRATPAPGVVSGSNGTGISHRRRKEMRLDSRGVAYWEWVESERQAELTQNLFEFENSGKCQTTIRFKASAAYPFLVPPALAPNVDYDVRFIFTAKGDDTVDVDVWGGHNWFPDYEAYVDGPGLRSLFYLYASPDTGPGVGNLGVQWKQFVSQTRNIPGPVPEECKCKSE